MQLSRAARERHRSRDVAIFLILRYTGMRQESVATLRVRNLYTNWGLRGVVMKGGKTRDVPLPAPVMEVSARLRARRPGQSVERSHARHAAVLVNVGNSTTRNGPCADDWKEYLAPEQGVRTTHRLSDAEASQQVRGLLGHTRIDTTQVYAQIQPRQLKQAVSFYEAKAAVALGG